MRRRSTTVWAKSRTTSAAFPKEKGATLRPQFRVDRCNRSAVGGDRLERVDLHGLAVDLAGELERLALAN